MKLIVCRGFSVRENYAKIIVRILTKVKGGLISNIQYFVVVKKKGEEKGQISQTPYLLSVFPLYASYDICENVLSAFGSSPVIPAYASCGGGSLLILGRFTANALSSKPTVVDGSRTTSSRRSPSLSIVQRTTRGSVRSRSLSVTRVRGEVSKCMDQ